MTKLSPNITLEQAVHSNTAIAEHIDNSTNDADLISNGTYVAINIFERVVAHFSLAKVWFESFYRCTKLNSEIGGAPSSQHCKFQAIDMHGLQGLLNVDLFHWIKANLEFDQLILEKKKGDDACWVHGSYSKTHNRKEVLIAKEIPMKDEHGIVIKDSKGNDKMVTKYYPYSKELFNEIYPKHAI